MVKMTGHKKFDVPGFSFKTGTDDLRESSLLVLIEMLLGKGYEVEIFDNNVVDLVHISKVSDPFDAK